jgi:hypothetical protein
MSTLPEARDDLEAALTTAGIRVTRDPAGLPAAAPAAILFGDGVDTGHIGRGQVVAGFRILLVAGAWDGASMADILAGLVSTALTCLRAMDGWPVGEVGPDSAVTVGSNRLLGCDIRTATMVTV